MDLRAVVSFFARRASATPGSVLAIVVTVLMLCVLAVSAFAGLSKLSTSALRDGLVSAPPDRSTVTVSAAYDAESPGRQDSQVRGVLRWLLGPLGGSVRSTARSVAYDIDDPGGARTEFWSVRGVDDRLRLRSGSWPGAAGVDGDPDSVAVAVHAPMAERFGLTVGERFRAVSRLDGSPVAVDVVGVWTLRGRGAWVDDPLLRSGKSAGSDATTWGPLLTTPEGFAAVASSVASVRWNAAPAWHRITPDALATTRARAAGLATRVDREVADQPGSDIELANPLPDLLAGQARALVALRSVALMPAGLMAALGGCGLVLAAALLTAARGDQQVLLRSRGASPAQLLRPVTIESGVIGLGAAVLAPPIAAGGFAFAGSPTALHPSSWAVSSAAAAACALTLTAPTLVASLRREGAGAQRRRSRRAMTLRVAGLLLVVAVGGFAATALLRYGVTRGEPTGPLVDPLLVAAPALVLVATTALATLLVWPVIRLAAGSGGRSRGLATALGTRSALRAPGKTLPLALVIALAAGTSAFALDQLASQRSSRAARATYLTGADIRAFAPAPARRLGGDAERAVLRGVAGVASAAGVHRSAGYLDELPVTTLAGSLPRLTGTALDGRAVSWGVSPETWQTLRSSNAAADDAIPVVVTSGLAESLGLGVGDRFAHSAFGLRLTVRIAGVVPWLATVPDGQAGILLGSDGLTERLRRAGEPAAPDEWWITVAAGDSQRAVAERLAALDGAVAAVRSRRAVAENLAAGPVAGGAGLELALRICAGAAVAVTLLLLGAVTLLNRSERLRQAAVLRALGAGTRAVLGAVGWQHLLIAVLGALLGLGAGTVVSWLLLEGLAAGSAGPAFVPTPSLVAPSGQLAVLTATLIALPTALALIAARRDLRRAATTGHQGQGRP